MCVHMCVCVCVCQTARDTLPCPLSRPVSECVAQRGPSVDRRWADSGGVRGPVSGLKQRGRSVLRVTGSSAMHTLDGIVRYMCGFTQSGVTSDGERTACCLSRGGAKLSCGAFLGLFWQEF